MANGIDQVLHTQESSSGGESSEGLIFREGANVSDVFEIPPGETYQVRPDNDDEVWTIISISVETPQLDADHNNADEIVADLLHRRQDLDREGNVIKDMSSRRGRWFKKSTPAAPDFVGGVVEREHSWLEIYNQSDTAIRGSFDGAVESSKTRTVISQIEDVIDELPNLPFAVYDMLMRALIAEGSRRITDPTASQESTDN